MKFLKGKDSSRSFSNQRLEPKREKWGRLVENQTFPIGMLETKEDKKTKPS